MLRSGSLPRPTAALAIAALSAVLVAAPVAAAGPTFDSFTDGPFDDLVVDCGSYQIHEVSTFSARIINYEDGTSRQLAVIDGWLYRSDDPGTVIGTERATTVRAIDGTIATVTGTPWHILIYGAGMTAHDAGRLVLDFVTREVFTETGTHPVLDGTFDFQSLCSL